MLASIIPYTRSIDDTLVTYRLPEEFRKSIKIGSAVTVPWGKDMITGIVANIAEDLPYQGELKDIAAPLCETPWLSPSEIAMVVEFARVLFMRLHVVAQLFLPIGIMSQLEKNNYMDLQTPVTPTGRGHATYTIAHDHASLIDMLHDKITRQPGVVIVPEGLSASWWQNESHIRDALLDYRPRSLARQRQIYLDTLYQSHAILFGTPRTLLKRLGHYKHVYLVHENLFQDIYTHMRSIPLWLLAEQLTAHGHIVHYLSTTPSVRSLTNFLKNGGTVKYV